jgi:hypothetical protein
MQKMASVGSFRRSETFTRCVLMTRTAPLISSPLAGGSCLFEARPASTDRVVFACADHASSPALEALASVSNVSQRRSPALSRNSSLTIQGKGSAGLRRSRREARPSLRGSLNSSMGWRRFDTLCTDLSVAARADTHPCLHQPQRQSDRRQRRLRARP